MMPESMQEYGRSYDRTWEEIESMLEQAVARQRDWIAIYHESKKAENQKMLKEAARNKKALEGVIKTFQWVLGEEGIKHPLH